tara:strand:+ start:9930 stop:11330 length:1401 start_codon:yes stop_codon:yes gene_type:complete
MTDETYKCPGCKKIRKAPTGQDIARCRICGTTVEKIDGVWLKSLPDTTQTPNTSKDSEKITRKNLANGLMAVIFILLGYFLIIPITETSWGAPLLENNALFWGVASMLIVSMLALILGFIIKRKYANLVFRFLTLFCLTALIKLTFVDKKIPLMGEINQKEIVQTPPNFEYSETELDNLSNLYFELITDDERLKKLTSTTEVNVSKTLDEVEKNYDYVVTPADTNTPYPSTFRISINNKVETDLQKQYYVERTAGLGLQIASEEDAIEFKNSIIQKFEDSFELFESEIREDESYWASVKLGNYYWVRFLTLDSDFMILEVVRYMKDSDARQHKKVMESVKNSNNTLSESKPLSPQEAIACKNKAGILDQEKSALIELEKRLAYLDFGDPKSEEHLSKEQEFNTRTSQYNTSKELYTAGCQNSVTLSYSTYTKACSVNDALPSGNPETSGNSFCRAFPQYLNQLKAN